MWKPKETGKTCKLHLKDTRIKLKNAWEKREINEISVARLYPSEGGGGVGCRWHELKGIALNDQFQEACYWLDVIIRREVQFSLRLQGLKVLSRLDSGCKWLHFSATLVPFHATLGMEKMKRKLEQHKLPRNVHSRHLPLVFWKWLGWTHFGEVMGGCNDKQQYSTVCDPATAAGIVQSALHQLGVMECVGLCSADGTPTLIPSRSLSADPRSCHTAN